MGKRGLSAVVTTLLIILLALVAIGIVWVVIKNIVSEGAEGISLERFSIDMSITNAYIDGESVKVGVRRSPGEGNVTGIKFVFFDGSDSFIVEKEFALEELEEKTFTFTSAEVGGINDVEEVSIAPIYESAGEDRIGEITDTSEIRSSPPPGVGNGDGNGGTGDPGTGFCGDDIVQSPNGDGINEVCDGTNYNGQSCISLGYAGGIIVCDSGCQFDTSGCTGGTPSSCDGTWDQSDIDDGNECDGGANCQLDCTCLAGFTSDGAGGCTLNPAINTGTVFSVWPAGAVKYFDSEDLPVDVAEYTTYYVNFSSSAENGCFRITWAEYLEANGRSYLRTEFIVDINPNEGYSVWEAENCGA